MGEWAWTAQDCNLQIVSLKNGQIISLYEFSELQGFENCCIKCVDEIFPGNKDSVLLAVTLECYQGQAASRIAIYSVDLGCVINSMLLQLHVTCVKFIEPAVCRRTIFQNFDGCLAVGSEEGVVVLLDLNVHKYINNTDEVNNIRKLGEPSYETTNGKLCHIVDYRMSLNEIHSNFRHCQQEGIYFGLQLEGEFLIIKINFLTF